MKKILLFGASGSIGQSTLKLVGANPDIFQIVGVSTHSRPELVERSYPLLNTKEKSSLQDIKDFIETCRPDMVLNAVGGFAGMKFSRATVELGVPLALANKESLVAAGDLLMPMAKEKGVPILPVDSEHSAIFQCLNDGSDLPQYKSFEKIYLTCSGGPFYGREDLSGVTPEQALRHPNWDMGAKITIDSATLANKCLEFIEAMHLFQADREQIEIVIHKQSIIHSMVEFCDGSVIAQLSPPDMTLPIAVALNHPKRSNYKTPRQAFHHLDLSFRMPDREIFRTLQVLDYCTQYMGNLPIIFNAVNEVCVEAFVNRKITFNQIFEILESILLKEPKESIQSFDHITNIDRTARDDTLALINK